MITTLQILRELRKEVGSEQSMILVVNALHQTLIKKEILSQVEIDDGFVNYVREEVCEYHDMSDVEDLLNEYDEQT
jgi:hypothetical protein